MKKLTVNISRIGQSCLAEYRHGRAVTFYVSPAMRWFNRSKLARWDREEGHALRREAFVKFVQLFRVQRPARFHYWQLLNTPEWHPLYDHPSEWVDEDGSKIVAFQPYAQPEDNLVPFGVPHVRRDDLSFYAPNDSALVVIKLADIQETLQKVGVRTVTGLVWPY